MTAFATVIAVGLDSKVTVPNLSLVYVIPVVVAAVAFGLGPSLCSAVLGALAYNFFFTEPRYSLMVDDPGERLGHWAAFRRRMYCERRSLDRQAQGRTTRRS